MFEVFNIHFQFTSFQISVIYEKDINYSIHCFMYDFNLAK